ncbi:MAG: ribonuclease P protein component 4 [Candidatus Methanomethylophilaceae archaeon]|nr:ribonuclease P protein component 4 [Candidatus Methanomethylophilaceae archaeon]
MSRKRVGNRQLKDIGAERITRLMDLSVQALREGRPDRSTRYVELSRRISAKTKVRMPRDRPFCKGCMMPLVPGLSCTVRLSDHRVVTTCSSCGRIRRVPYIKEQRK